MSRMCKEKKILLSDCEFVLVGDLPPTLSACYLTGTVNPSPNQMTGTVNPSPSQMTGTVNPSLSQMTGTVNPSTFNWTGQLNPQPFRIKYITSDEN